MPTAQKHALLRVFSGVTHGPGRVGCHSMGHRRDRPRWPHDDQIGADRDGDLDDGRRRVTGRHHDARVAPPVLIAQDAPGGTWQLAPRADLEELATA